MNIVHQLKINEYFQKDRKEWAIAHLALSSPSQNFSPCPCPQPGHRHIWLQCDYTGVPPTHPLCNAV